MWAELQKEVGIVDSLRREVEDKRRKFLEVYERDQIKQMNERLAAKLRIEE